MGLAEWGDLVTMVPRDTLKRRDAVGLAWCVVVRAWCVVVRVNAQRRCCMVRGDAQRRNSRSCASAT